MTKTITESCVTIAGTGTAMLGIKESDGVNDTYYTVELELTELEIASIMAILENKI